MKNAAKQLQTDWFDVFMAIPIKRKFIPYSETLATLAGMDKANVRVMIMEVKQGGYIITTR